ncbi:unnamed protein product [Musa banksii]
MLSLSPLPFLLSLFFLPQLSLSLNREGLSLLQAKNSLADPGNALSDWNPLDSTPCNWTGVTCGSTSLAFNNFSGDIPPSFGQFPRLRILSLLNLSYNAFSPSPIPVSFANLTQLRILWLAGCNLVGPVPSDLGRLSSLLYANSLSGTLPRGLSNLTALRFFDASMNKLYGHLPEDIFLAPNLANLQLYENNLVGSLPQSLGRCTSLTRLSGNFFSGSISPVISGAANLSMLLISDNQFSGSIPEEIGALSNLYDQLNLADNDISGGVPPELGDLPVLNYLDLSGNKLSGEIPMELQNLNLIEFNLSNNQLSGGLPPLLATQTYQNSFLGNPGLCGELTGFCPSPRAVKPERHVFVWLLRSVFILASLVLVTGAAWFYWRYRNLKKAALGMDNPKWKFTSFYKLGFSEEEIPVSLDEDNVIGSGASGQVYKVVLSNGETVAVKKLWGTSKKNDIVPSFGDGFEAEVEMLGKIRHKNIVKLWCCCTNIDSKLLVFEYMPNGSLGDQLHGAKGGLLDWRTRYKIALDAAEGLSYLHHDCLPPIVHRDVKSNNILLDAEFGAKVSDFGVAKAIVKGPKSMSVIAGSCGYIAPEYAYTLRVTEKSDIYSFGVVILELITGKFPMDPELGERDLAQWVCSTLEQKGVESVIDPRLSLCFKEEIREVLDVGLLCTNFLPLNRPPMRTVQANHLRCLADFCGRRHQRKKKVFVLAICTLYQFHAIFLSSNTAMNHEDSTISVDAAIALVGVVLLALSVVLYVICKKRCAVDPDDTSTVAILPAHSHQLSDVESATDGFHGSRVVGQGRLGTVYKATSATGDTYTVKRIHHHLVLGNPGVSFSSRMKSLSYANHPNLSLDYHLHQSYLEDCRRPSSGLLSWDIRIRVAAGTARGIEHLHDGSVPGIVHGCIKPSNIMLDMDFCARICDYGLSFLVEPGDRREMVGYRDGEGGGACKENDVYGLGVVLLELLSGRRCDGGKLVEWALPLIRECRVREILDGRMGLPMDLTPLTRMAKVASACVGNGRKTRPSIAHVAAILSSLEAQP